VTVRQELISGTIERFLVSAHGPVNGILGTTLFPNTRFGEANCPKNVKAPAA
jgi:hypothetical protein